MARAVSGILLSVGTEIPSLLLRWPDVVVFRILQLVACLQVYVLSSV